MPQLPKPAIPHISGSTTPCTSAQVIAASTALPPAFRIRAPASTASGCGATIIALFAVRIGGPIAGVVGRPRPSLRRPQLAGERVVALRLGLALQVLVPALIVEAEDRRAEVALDEELAGLDRGLAGSLEHADLASARDLVGPVVVDRELHEVELARRVAEEVAGPGARDALHVGDRDQDARGAPVRAGASRDDRGDPAHREPEDRSIQPLHVDLLSGSSPGGRRAAR